MPYKVLSSNCRVGGRIIPQGTILNDNQITGSAAEALLASKQIERVNPVPAPAAPASPSKTASKVEVAG